MVRICRHNIAFTGLRVLLRVNYRGIPGHVDIRDFLGVFEGSGQEGLAVDESALVLDCLLNVAVHLDGALAAANRKLPGELFAQQVVFVLRCRPRPL